MTDPDTEIAREIAYQCSEGLGLGGTGWGKHIQFVLDKIRSVRQAENEASASRCEDFCETPMNLCGKCRACRDAKAIRNRQKEKL